MHAYLDVMAAPVYCTRTASRLVRTYTDRHGLKELVKEMLGQDLSQAAADQRLGRARDQRRPARICRERRPLPARLKEQLDERLVREGRAELAQACFDFLPARALLDLAGWAEQDIFAHV